MSTKADNGRSTRRLVAVAGVIAIAVGLFVGAPTSEPATAAPGDSGPRVTDSAVTLTARGYDPNVDSAPYPDLSVTVGQTKDLVNQGVSLSWSGAQQTTGRSLDLEHYFQVFQCWGEDPANPGRPDKDTCQYGAVSGGQRSYRYSGGFDAPQPIDPLENPKNMIKASGYRNTFLIPFRSVNGVTIAGLKDGEPVNSDGTVTPPPSVFGWTSNEFFTPYTTNEATFVTGPGGRGRADFEVQTGLEAPGLGCGEPADIANEEESARSCWLVILPRGAMSAEPKAMYVSGLLESVWRHHLAVKLDFQPTSLTCPVGAAERAIVGSELATEAIRLWQPALCRSGTRRTFTYGITAESDALTRVANTGSGLAVTSRPSDLGPTDPLAYAPVLLTGAAIGVAIDQVLYDGTAEQMSRNASPIDELNLTPRLLAKLLTGSYSNTLQTNGPQAMDYSHLENNPAYLPSDPEFLSVNDPSWTTSSVRNIAIPLTPLGRSDVAHAIWSYVLADDEARRWLAGEPDEWGMTVNPWYASTDTANASGAALEYPREDFPRADPASSVASRTEPSLDLVTFRPFVDSFETAARQTLRGDSKKVDFWDTSGTTPRWKPILPDAKGAREQISTTTVPAVARYSIVAASLRNPAGQFVSPTDASILGAADLMTPTGPSGTLKLDLTAEQVKSAKEAYPLTMPVYAAADPLSADAEARADYAGFIRLAATTGQEPGTGVGNLPDGYAPLPEAWRAQALATADAIEFGRPLPPTAGPSNAPTSTTPSNSEAPSAANRAAASAGARAAAAPTGAAPVGAGPTATGGGASALVGAKTPNDQENPLGLTMPIGLAGGLVLLAAAPFLGRRRGAQ